MKLGEKLKLNHQVLNRGLLCEKAGSNRLIYGTASLYHSGTELFIVADSGILRIVYLCKNSVSN